ncbi:MAG: gluconokinase [Chitinophagaceae bacterium]|nr:gluconokinase [Chitinophagaceae bacterium]
MGVSGSGKSTIGSRLSMATGIPFFDGDDFHSQANREKMRSGQPLTDYDRQDWLVAINQLARREAFVKGAIIACSALKEKYRSILSDSLPVTVRWVFLQGEISLIQSRMQSRTGHFMPETLLQSQFDALELPVNAIVIDIGRSAEEIVEEVVEAIFNRQ